MVFIKEKKADLQFIAINQAYMYAGLTGLILAGLVSNIGAVSPIKHLRSLNPYVMAALIEWRQRHGTQAFVPLQNATGIFSASSSGDGPIASASSFGMSGVNAHALIKQTPNNMAIECTGKTIEVFVSGHCHRRE